MHKNVLNQDNSVVLIVDIQEKFRHIIYKSEKIIQNTLKIVKAANILNIPVIYTEQYPKGLGKTVPELSDLLQNAKYYEKQDFSCCKDNTLMEYLESLNKKQVIICGVETHVCVSQTVHDLLEKGYQSHVIIDAVSSRIKSNHKIGINKMEKSGAVISCVEIALFECLKSSSNKNFKEVQKLII